MESLSDNLYGMLADQIDPPASVLANSIRPLNFYGANAKIFEHKTGEIVLSGPADTGKTFAVLQYLHTLCLTYPGLQAAMIRQTARSIAGSCFESYNKKIVPPGVIKVAGGVLHPEQIQYKNGSVIWIGGMDNPDKVLSSERDVVYINQLEELGLRSYEYITTRATGRAGNMPGYLILGDCNPGPPSHWILKREKARKLTRLISTHRDNPEIYDPETGEITEGGKIRLGVLAGLTGAREARLYRGLWVAPEGAIYGIFTESGHTVEDFPIPAHWPRIVGIDPVGAYTAAIWLAYDPENGVFYLYREYYEPFGLTTPDHAKAILDKTKGESVFLWAGGGPSENQARLDFYAAGIPMVAPAVVEVWSGIDKVLQLLKDNALYIFKSCQYIIGEIADYHRVVSASGEITERIENKELFHLLDALRYAIVALTGRGDETEEQAVTINHRIGGDY